MFRKKYKGREELQNDLINPNQNIIRNVLRKENESFLEEVFPHIPLFVMALIIEEADLERALKFFRLILHPYVQGSVLVQYMKKEKVRELINQLTPQEKQVLNEWFRKTFKSNLEINFSNEGHYTGRVDQEWLDQILNLLK